MQFEMDKRKVESEMRAALAPGEEEVLLPGTSAWSEAHTGPVKAVWCNTCGVHGGEWTDLPECCRARAYKQSKAEGLSEKVVPVRQSAITVQLIQGVTKFDTLEKKMLQRTIDRIIVNQDLRVERAHRALQTNPEQVEHPIQVSRRILGDASNWVLEEVLKTLGGRLLGSVQQQIKAVIKDRDTRNGYPNLRSMGTEDLREQLEKRRKERDGGWQAECEAIIKEIKRRGKWIRRKRRAYDEAMEELEVQRILNNNF